MMNENYNNMGDPNMGNPNMGDPNMGNYNMGNPNMVNPNMGNPNMGNPNMGYNMNAPNLNVKLSEKWDSINGVFIKQKKNVAEALTGCDLENKYYVYNASHKEKKKGGKIFKIKEKSSCLQRLCVPLDCREMSFKVYNYLDKDESDDSKKCLVIHKPCTLTCCCCNRPNITISHTEDGKEKTIGKVTDPCDLCNYNFLINDEKNNPRFRLIAKCCQLAIWCNGFPCKACEEAEIDIFDLKNNSKKIGTMKKKAKNCLHQAVFDTGNYYVPFAENLNWSDKCLLMCSAIFVDYLLFQNNDQQDNNNY